MNRKPETRPGWPDWRLLLVAPPLLALTRVALMALPLGLTRRALKRAVAIAPSRRRARAERVGACVRFASRRMPGIGSCLTEALVAEALLARTGQPARLRIGIARSRTGGIDAHAWVECAGRIVVGEVDDLARYRLLGNEPRRPQSGAIVHADSNAALKEKLHARPPA